MMKHTILTLLAGLFPALATAQSSQELYQLREEYPFSSNDQLLEIYERRKREGQKSFVAPGKEYEALTKQLEGYQRQEEEKSRVRDQQQRAYQGWITGNSPPRSQNRYRPPQKTQRSTGYGNNRQRQGSCRGNDWNEFDVMCQSLGNATNNYPPGYFLGAPKCHRVVWK